ncbi:MAG: transposase [Halomonas sp.]|nr:transposase [Halomonas sp.]MDM7480979.1 transposase [Halomonas sp.]
MTRPRSELVCVTDTPWYHVVSRCVRRAFLCGQDSLTGKSYDHRRGWIEARIRQLASVFTLDVAAYAVMSNHYHIVVRIDRARAQALSDDEVLARWTQLFDGPLLVQRYQNPATRAALDAAELARVQEYAALYRERLSDLSWFMRVLNEGIAREANREDGVKGRFWEGRFKSQALLDEEALLMAMSYVDLNPIRAGLCETPEESDYTSVQARLAPEKVEARVTQSIAQMAAKAINETQPNALGTLSGEALDSRADEPLEAKETAQAALQPAPLLPFDATGREDWAIPYALSDYLELVETLGRCLHPHKRGFIPEKTPRLLERLGVDTEAFIAHGTRFLKEFGTAVGKPAALIELAARRQAKFLRGMRTARSLLARAAGGVNEAVAAAKTPAERVQKKDTHLF